MRLSSVALWGELTGDDEDFLGDAIGDGLGELLSGGGGHGPVAFGNGALLGINVYLALGADLTADPLTWSWTLIPNDLVRHAPGITCTTGRGNESTTVSYGTGSLTFDNRDGRFSRKNPTGPYYGLLTRNTPILVEVNPGNVAYPFLRQFVNEWPVEFDPTATDVTVPIRTGGILRRLGQGSTPLSGAIRRSMLGDPDVIAYWPCEDGQDSNTLASAISGKPHLPWVGTVAPGTSTTTGLAGEALPVLSPGRTYYLAGVKQDSSKTEWTHGALYYFTSVPVYTAGTDDSYLLYAAVGGQARRWVLYWNDADNTLYLETRSATATLMTIAGPTITNAEMIDCWLTFWVSAKQNGANIDYAFGVERTTTTGTSSSATSGTLNTTTVASLDGFLAFNAKSAASVVLGHLFGMDRALTSAENTPMYGAVNGYVGEAATDRIMRLCAEEGVPLSVVPGTAPSAAMGAQSSTSGFLAAVREAEAADGGVLYEDGWGLGFQPLSARYNMVPSLRLDIADGDIAGTPRPTDDDQGLRNSWTVARSGGSSATFTDEESVAAEGGVVYPDSVTLNLATDDQCDQAAGWLVHLGTNDEYRWPSLPLRFHDAAGLAHLEAWTLGAGGFGKRLTIANPPVQMSPTGDLIDVIIEGKTERVDELTWTADLNTSPARTFQVFELESLTDNDGRFDTDGSSLSVAIDSDDTSLTVATPGICPWVSTALHPDQFPFDVEIGGERLTATAVVGATTPQTFTVVRSVNGVVKSHAAGADVRLWHAAVMAR